ncbi:RNA polymerase sigma factor [Streptoalloteichus tenebrarius]|uniref:RNA polymerase sigma factor n=2 Tax=Streptoalloteichus tenebrarius (strain ATCC 17920 / DSM 40477 / JCM 4838 / CBS 697.72 / NBRC 16177 / NCIMB 11028 / NRRL B-12390 / A12253. 1 / ISP 5477) TaxID=1933 RepID=UPI0035E8D27C
MLAVRGRRGHGRRRDPGQRVASRLTSLKQGMDMREGASARSAEASFWQACVELRPLLVQMATHYCGSGYEAEDVVHDALVRAAEFPRLDRNRMRPFLVAVVRRLCVDRFRRRSVARQLGEHPRLLPCDVEDPAELVSDRAEARWLLRRCGPMSNRERRILLSLASGQGHREIARELGITTRASESAASRARCRARRRVRRVS